MHASHCALPLARLEFSFPLFWLEDIAADFSACPACLQLHLAYEKSQCSLSASSVA